MLIKNKNGQTGTTLTWLIATIVIVVVLVLAIFLVQIYGGNRGKIQGAKIADIPAKKSFLSFLLTKSSDGKVIYQNLNSEENISKSDGELGAKIFNGFYKKDYLWGVWLGFIESGKAVENEFFGELPSNFAVGSYAVAIPNSIILEKIKINENKKIGMILIESGGEDYKKENE